MVSGSVSLPCSGFFSPFPHGTGPLSVSQEYLALADGPAGFTQGFTCPALLRIPLCVTSLARKGLSPAMAQLSNCFRFVAHAMSWSYNPNNAETSLVWAAPLSLATTHGITLVFSSSAYLDVSVRRVRPPHKCGVTCLQHAGLPHSEIRGSIRMCRSPRLFAAYHVLLRLWEPRHPPYALLLLVATPAHKGAEGPSRNPSIKLLLLLRVSSTSLSRKMRNAPSQYVNELFDNANAPSGSCAKNVYQTFF